MTPRFLMKFLSGRRDGLQIIGYTPPFSVILDMPKIIQADQSVSVCACRCVCEVYIWNSSPYVCVCVWASQVDKSVDWTPRLYPGGLPNECRHPETGHLFLQAFQGSLEARHWPYQAKGYKWTQMKAGQRIAVGKRGTLQETLHPFDLRKSAGISMDGKQLHSPYCSCQETCSVSLI